jgi:hypothetical protein
MLPCSHQQNYYKKKQWWINTEQYADAMLTNDIGVRRASRKKWAKRYRKGSYFQEHG